MFSVLLDADKLFFCAARARAHGKRNLVENLADAICCILGLVPVSTFYGDVLILGIADYLPTPLLTIAIRPQIRPDHVPTPVKILSPAHPELSRVVCQAVQNGQTCL